MITSHEDTKLVVVKSTGVLKELGYISGPILHPSRIKMQKIVAMVNNGKIVYEVNPKDQKEQVLLTRLNVSADNFSEKKEAKVETPVEKKPDTEGPTAEIPGLGSIAREAIDPTYTPAAEPAVETETAPSQADNAVEAEATVEETPVETVSSEGEVKADEVPADESAETASVAEEEVAPEASSDVDNSQPSDVENFRNYYGKKNKKNRNR